jgi:hypothetical protein
MPVAIKDLKWWERLYIKLMSRLFKWRDKRIKYGEWR